MRHSLRYRVLLERLAVCQLAVDVGVPEWAVAGGFFCVMRNTDELSIVCEEDRVPPGVRVETGWSALKIEGPFPFSMTGVLASFVQPLADAGISIFAISTFDTDYVLVKHECLAQARSVLASAGHSEIATQKH